MNFEAEVYVTIIPKRNRDRQVVGAQIGQFYRKRRPDTIRLSISVPETYFQSPTIRAVLPDKPPEVWTAHPIEMPDAEGGSEAGK